MNNWEEQLREGLNNKKECVWTIKVIPGSSRNEVVDIMTDGTIKIRIAAAPENNRANKELIKFLEKTFKKKAVILSGSKAKLKIVKIIDFL